MIFSITGSSGVGKTETARKILELHPDTKMVTSRTSRGARPTDLPGEYEYNRLPVYFGKNKDNFLWVKFLFDIYYGTLKISVEEALGSPKLWLILLMPETVPLLHKATAELGYTKQDVRSFFILSPGEDELRRRLEERDGPSPATEKRILDCKKMGR